MANIFTLGNLSLAFSHKSPPVPVPSRNAEICPGCFKLNARCFIVACYIVWIVEPDLVSHADCTIKVTSQSQSPLLRTGFVLRSCWKASMITCKRIAAAIVFPLVALRWCLPAGGRHALGLFKNIISYPSLMLPLGLYVSNFAYNLSPSWAAINHQDSLLPPIIDAPPSAPPPISIIFSSIVIIIILHNFF